jgi:hypothetical protein
MKKMLTTAFLVALVLSTGSTATFASTFSAKVYSDRVHANISVSLTQNITSLFHRSFAVSGVSLTDASRAIEQQVKTKSPQASLKDVSIQCTFTNTTIESIVEFDVLSVAKREDMIIANFTWRALEVLDDLVAEGVNYNQVGKAYFRVVIPRYENMTGVRFYENRTVQVTHYRASDLAGNITMLRFRALGVPLSRWDMTYNITTAETTYKLRVGRIVDLVAKRETNSSATSFGIWMELTGEIVAPGFATLRGEAVVSEAQVGLVQLSIFGAVTIPLVTLIVAHLTEKRRVRLRAEGRRR